MKKLSLLASYLQFDLLTTDAGGVNLNSGWFSAFNSSRCWDGSVSPVTGRRKTSKEVWPGVTAAPPGTNSWQLSWRLDEDSEAFISEVRFTTETTELRRAEPSALSGTKENTERCDLTQNILLHLSSWSLNPGFGLFPSLQVGSWHFKKWFCDF